MQIRYRVLERAFIDGAIREPGDIVVGDASLAGPHLEEVVTADELISVPNTERPPYQPDGMDTHLVGANDRETIDLLWLALLEARGHVTGSAE